MVEIHDLDAVSLAAAIKRRDVSPVEAAGHFLQRIAERDSELGAFITVREEQVVDEARQREKAVLSGGWLPPLLGVPIPVKDLVAVAGLPCSMGSAVFANWVPDGDDGVVRRLRQAGTVMLGKTNTCEFGLSCYTESVIAPAARTPWDPARSAGGSSGGAGTAVAAGFAPAALGTDGGGSVRIPASACGLVGIKPSRGLVSPGPRLGDVSGLATAGPLARTVRDAAVVLDAIAGAGLGDPWPIAPPADSYESAAARDPGRLRVGCWRDPVLAPGDVHPEVVAAYESARTLLAGLGHEIFDAPSPFGPEAVESFEVVWAVLSALPPVPADEEERLMPLTRWMRRQADEVSGARYAGAFAGMQAAARRAAQLWEPYDVLLSPTLARPPSLIGEIRDDEDPAADFQGQKEFSPYCAVYNVTGQPAVNLPLHWTCDDVPVGVMIGARRGEDDLLISLAAQLEAAQPWHQRRPQGW